MPMTALMSVRESKDGTSKFRAKDCDSKLIQEAAAKKVCGCVHVFNSI
jgi:hypothetical protein